MKWVMCAAVAASGIAASTVVSAQVADNRDPAPYEPGRSWKMCDGFGGPSVSGDGMINVATTLLVFIPTKGGDTVRKNTTASREAIVACDQDLADPLIQGRFAKRRASLLRAKAVHQLSAEDVKGALESLDLASQSQATDDDRYYRRSFGTGLDYVRAYALAANGDTPGAKALARQTWSQRPYSKQIALAATILMGRTGDRTDVREALQAQARLEPRRIDALFLEAIDARRWSEAVAIYPHLVPPRKGAEPPGYDFQLMVASLESRALGEAFWAARGSLRAIALAEMGRAQEAQSALDETRQRLANAVSTIPPMELNGKRVKAKFLPDYAARLNTQLAKQAPGVIDEAAREVARIASEGPSPPEDRGAAKPLGEPAEELSALLSTLPEVELAERVQPFAAMSKSFFADDTGYTENIDAARGVISITYRSHVSAAATVEEMALLRAAQYALGQGKGGFVITDRRDTRHTLAVSTYPGIPGNPGPDGHSTWLEIVPVDLQAPPAAFQDARWRILDAKSVVDALVPLYPSKAKAS